MPRGSAAGLPRVGEAGGKAPARRKWAHAAKSSAHGSEGWWFCAFPAYPCTRSRHPPSARCFVGIMGDREYELRVQWSRGPDLFLSFRVPACPVFLRLSPSGSCWFCFGLCRLQSRRANASSGMVPVIHSPTHSFTRLIIIEPGEVELETTETN